MLRVENPGLTAEVLRADGVVFSKAAAVAVAAVAAVAVSVAVRAVVGRARRHGSLSSSRRRRRRGRPRTVTGGVRTRAVRAATGAAAIAAAGGARGRGGSSAATVSVLLDYQHTFRRMNSQDHARISGWPVTFVVCDETDDLVDAEACQPDFWEKARVRWLQYYCDLTYNDSKT